MTKNADERTTNKHNADELSANEQCEPYEEDRPEFSAISQEENCGGDQANAYLDTIMLAVLSRLEKRKKTVPLQELQQKVAAQSLTKPPSFSNALRLPGVSLIAEVKRASPSKGPLRPDLDVVSLVQAYERGGARAISVLTEEDYFHGSLDDLRAAVATTKLPVLRKDFIVDEYQVYEACEAGAAAILLIAALLSKERLETLTTLAGELGLDVLLEVHDEMEAQLALGFPQVVVGANNRDLRTFQTSLDTTIKIAKLIPLGRLLVGESGINTHEDVRLLAAKGVDGVLIGEVLLRSSDPEATAADLVRWVDPTKMA